MLNFAIMHLAPGNPVDMLVDPSAPQETVEYKKEQLGLNDPAPVQYAKWLSGLLQGELGYSLSTSAPVSEMIAERLKPTLLLSGLSLLLGLLLAIPAGIWCALRPGSRLDHVLTGLAFANTSIPRFFLALALIYLFANVLDWLPSGGMYSLGGDRGWTDSLKHLILPVVVLGTLIAGKLLLYIRSAVLDVLAQDYMRTARSKGLHPWRVLNWYLLRNALIPLITVVSAEVPHLLGGSIIIEQIFQWPGVGQLTIQALMARDYPTLMGLNLVAAAIVLAANLLADLAYTAADPRIKLE
ncbi:ABC transporter permease [Paenibacillus hemerocallicola]|uniref:ABC transporter permease n=1 Tax=Paenibacillus hemerocallicola TaxID=1172614 RepID=A0A5C4TDH8_9BACL|nr:ABC transporter permease [Paenibacillus hemerocallicola]